MSSYSEKALMFDFAGKTVKEILSWPNEKGLVSDIVIIFTDGTERVIGACTDGFLVCTIRSDEPFLANVKDQPPEQTARHVRKHGA